jgi:hypothetical protein
VLARACFEVKGERGYVGSFFDDLVNSDGSPNWCEAPSGSYEY